MSTLIIHHANCPDGFGSAWVMNRHLGGYTEIVAAKYGDPLPDNVDGRSVVIVDFCYQTPQLVELCERADNVVILDHHKSALEYVVDTPFALYTSVNDYMEASEYDRFLAILDMEHSGIGIVLEWCTPMVVPGWLYHLEDRDLWRFQFPETSAVFAAITSYPQTLDMWDGLARRSTSELAVEGQAIERYRRNLINQTLETAYPFRLPDGTDVLMAACPYAVGSDVAGELAKTSPSRIGAYFVPYGSYNKYGLRSTADGPDVAEIAARCAPGGGGHAHASGFELHLAP